MKIVACDDNKYTTVDFDSPYSFFSICSVEFITVWFKNDV